MEQIGMELPGGRMKAGDLVLTNFFGEPHRICLLIKQPRPQTGYGSEPPCLVLTGNGTQVWFQQDALLTLDEYHQ